MTVELAVTSTVEVVRKHPQAHCEGCPLYESGTYVPSSFPTEPCSTGNRLAFVGEAPGENEVKQGKVFIGQSGKVLDGILEGGKHVVSGEPLDISRAEALMTNAAACHYPQEMERLPTAAVEHCRPRLLWEMEQAGVRTAVTLGAHAVRSLLATNEGITAVRAGKPRPSDYAAGVMVVPTFHPAYAMRNHAVFPLIVNDIAKVLGRSWDEWEGIPYRVITSEEEASQEINRLWETVTDPIVCDTESGRDKDETFGGGIKEVLCIGLWDEQRGVAVVFPRDVFSDENRRALGRLFTRNGLDGQNLKYDICRVLNVFLGIDGLLDLKIKGDRMLQSYCLHEVSGIHGLDYMGREHLGAPQWKHWIKDSMEEGRRRAKAKAKARGEKIGDRFKGLDYSLVDRNVLHKYNAYDVGVTRRLDDHFTPLLEEVDGLP